MAREHAQLIDWLSFTFPVDYSKGKIAHENEVLAEALENYLGASWQTIATLLGDWEPRPGRAPYNSAYWNRAGLMIYWHIKLDHALLEISGQGCAALRQIETLNAVITSARERITRIDLAVDIRTDTLPIDFVKQANTGRFKAIGTQTSKSGQTVYIGSKSSERYCRVYRYFKPHPRGDFLRTEFVFRKKTAKLFVETLIASEFALRPVAIGAGDVYGFHHPDWDLGTDPIKLSSYTPERRSGKTLSWMVSQVAPAFIKLCRDGAIEDPEAFLKTYFIDPIGEKTI